MCVSENILVRPSPLKAARINFPPNPPNITERKDAKGYFMVSSFDQEIELRCLFATVIK